MINTDAIYFIEDMYIRLQEYREHSVWKSQHEEPFVLHSFDDKII